MSGVLARVRSRLQRQLVERLSTDALKTRLGQRRGLLTLCYHSVMPGLESYAWRTDPSALDRQLAFLREIFEIVATDEAVARLRGGLDGAPSRPMAAISFDDGYRDNWTTVTPILEKHQIPATLFASKDLVRRGGETHMGENELRSLSAHGLWRVGGHAVSHNALTALAETDQHEEIRESKHWLEDLLGDEPAGFAYPQGQLSPRIVRLTGMYFDHAFSTDIRVGDGFDPLQIRRYCPVAGDDDIRRFACSLLLAPMEDGSSDSAARAAPE